MLHGPSGVHGGAPQEYGFVKLRNTDLLFDYLDPALPGRCGMLWAPQPLTDQWISKSLFKQTKNLMNMHE